MAAAAPRPRPRLAGLGCGAPGPLAEAAQPGVLGMLGSPDGTRLTLPDNVWTSSSADTTPPPPAPRVPQQALLPVPGCAPRRRRLRSASASSSSAPPAAAEAHSRHIMPAGAGAAGGAGGAGEARPSPGPLSACTRRGAAAAPSRPGPSASALGLQPRLRRCYCSVRSAAAAALTAAAGSAHQARAQSPPGSGHSPAPHVLPRGLRGSLAREPHPPDGGASRKSQVTQERCGRGTCGDQEGIAGNCGTDQDLGEGSQTLLRPCPSSGRGPLTEAEGGPQHELRISFEEKGLRWWKQGHLLKSL